MRIKETVTIPAATTELTTYTVTLDNNIVAVQNVCDVVEGTVCASGVYQMVGSDCDMSL